MEHEPQNEPHVSMHSQPATPDQNAAVDAVLGIDRTKCPKCGSVAGWDQKSGCLECGHRLKTQPAQQQEPVTVLPDGSAFAVMSYPLPKDHWLYADRQYNEGEYEPVELGKPVLTHELRDAVVSAVRYAIRGATNCGKESDFDPDAMVQNAVYALCGPFTSPPPRKPLTEAHRRELINKAWNEYLGGDGDDSFSWYLSEAIEAAHGIKGDA